MKTDYEMNRLKVRVGKVLSARFIKSKTSNTKKGRGYGRWGITRSTEGYQYALNSIVWVGKDQEKMVKEMYQLLIHTGFQNNVTLEGNRILLQVQEKPNDSACNG